MKKVGIFIDGLNVRKRLLECKWEEFFDVEFLAEQLAGPRELVSALYYHPAPNTEHLGKERYSFERAYLERVAKGEFVSVPSGAYMAKKLLRFAVVSKLCIGRRSKPMCFSPLISFTWQPLTPSMWLSLRALTQTLFLP